jgi:hypothetical protein
MLLLKRAQRIPCFNDALFSSLPIRFSKKKLSTNSDHVHFKVSSTKHPLIAKKGTTSYDVSMGDHSGRLQNHIWTKEEINDKMSTLYHHNPVTFTDHLVHKFMYGLYHTFNFITGYKPENPTVKAIEWRLIVLESVAGVPGFVAAGFRHFRSLRQLQRDHGWIATLLEEAENERMHLLVCLQMFKASYLTRFLVLSGQVIMTPVLMSMYFLNPKSLHRFVGYLEETACTTYVNVIQKIDTPGTHLHEGWSKLRAPPLALGYWKLQEEATWKDVLGCIMADETHHRDVNHTLATMKSDDPNPFVSQFKEDAAQAWRLNNENITKIKFSEKKI